MPTLFFSAKQLSDRLHTIRSSLSAQHRNWSRRAYLRHCLQTLPLSQWSMKKIALDRKALNEKQLHRLMCELFKLGNKLHHNGKISSPRWKEICDRLTHTDWDDLEESLSPYHPLLMEKDFYRCSAIATRRLLRRQAADFAKRHKSDRSHVVL